MLGFSFLTRSQTHAPFSGGMSLDNGTTGGSLCGMFSNAFLMTFLVVPWLGPRFRCKVPHQGTKIVRELRLHMPSSKEKKRKEKKCLSQIFLYLMVNRAYCQEGGRWFGFLEGCWKGENVLYSLLTKSPVPSFVSLWK